MTKMLAKYPITDYLNKGMRWEEKWFEDPSLRKHYQYGKPKFLRRA
jgi:hypothetical protein